MFSLKITETSNSTLEKLVSIVSSVKSRLEQRIKLSPSEFADMMKLREETHHLGMMNVEVLLLLLLLLLHSHLFIE